MTTYVIGDIQGCLDRLDVLLGKIEEASPNARLVFAGDLVNRGPHSLETLRRARGLGERARIVLGNHDLHLLAVSEGIRSPHRSDTIDDILQAPDRDELLEWLRHQPLALFEEEHLIVHAGVLPQWSAQRTMELASEVEDVLRSPGWVDFLRQMYGNTPAQWSDDLRGADRLRCIVNALTRLRFCDAQGAMDMKSKGAETVLPGYMPWFEVPGRQTSDVTVVFGHWSTLGLLLRPKLIALDTGCVWGGKLSAVSLGERHLIQIECPCYQTPGEA